jgi:hypothetical protein
MNRHSTRTWCVAGVLAALGLGLGLQMAMGDPPAPADTEDGVQVLTRGPVHEAFAETVTFNPEPGVVVPKEPPAAIEELPPAEKPQGSNVAWIPGYWAWDDARSDFLWVSGIWRDLPPGRQWVPGYWGNAAQGHQWTSGYWADASTSDVAYLPEPPATVEAGPNIAAPSANDIWQPGCWVWVDTRYAWRPGYWMAAQPDWVWVPAHYVCTPRGYLFVGGYWDYAIARRGVLFAPVYFSAGVYVRPRFSYSPSIVINLGLCIDQLFLRPRCHHYYFGDYYARSYRGLGFYPCYAYNSRRFGYDPIFAHERWIHRQDPQWDRRVAAEFVNRRDNEKARPPHTWAAQKALGAKAGAVAVPLTQFTKSQDNLLKFQAVNQAEQQKLAQRSQDVQKFGKERQTLEAKAPGAIADKTSKQFVPGAAKLPRSPIASQPVNQLGKNQVPPKIRETPKPDLKVEAKPNVIRSTEPRREDAVKRAPLDVKQPTPKLDRPAPKPQPQPKVDRPIEKPASGQPPAGRKKDERDEKGKDKQR